jgi:beta-glucosidase
MLAPDVADLDDHYPDMTSILAGIRAHVSAETDVRHARGCDVNGTSTDGFAAAVAAARDAEVAVMVVGDHSGLTDGATSGEARDRAELGLPGVQGALLDAVIETGTPVVVVLLGGRPLALPELEGRAAAILCAWLPGEEGGAAVADALFGDVNPGGKLPVTFPRAAAQIPVYYNHKPSGNRSHWKGDYVDMPTSPWLPFGHGLSYTTFAYGDLSVAPERIGAGGEVEIAFTVRNTGERAGDEVVQLYVRDPVGSVTRPVKELKGFRRIHLSTGGSVRVVFRLAASQLGFHDRSMDFVVEPGDIEVMIGSSSADIRLQGAFQITGDTTRVTEKTYFSHVELA